MVIISIVIIYVIVISAKHVHILICVTVYDNVGILDYIDLPSLIIIMHRLTSISYTLYSHLYQYFVILVKCVAISTTLETTFVEENIQVCTLSMNPSIGLAYILHGVNDFDGLLTVDQERCHPPYKMCRQAHVTECRNEHFVVDVIKSFARISKDTSHESRWLVGWVAPRIDHRNKSVYFRSTEWRFRW